MDGEVVGTWTRVVRGRELVIEPTPFDRLTAGVRRELAAAARACGAFVGRPVRLAEDDVTR